MLSQGHAEHGICIHGYLSCEFSVVKDMIDCWHAKLKCLYPKALTLEGALCNMAKHSSRSCASTTHQNKVHIRIKNRDLVDKSFSMYEMLHLALDQDVLK